MKEILIGRDAETNKLRITVDGKSAAFGAADSVPRSVSQQHVKLTIGNDGSLLLTNLNVDNDTFVNHRGIEAKYITHGDRITLGGENYKLTWDILDPFIPKMADISGLQQVWDEYQEKRLQMQIKERRFNTLRSATGLLTMAAMVLGFSIGRGGAVFFLYIAAAVISLAFFVIAFMQSSRIPREQDQLLQDTKRRYKCPACGRLLNLQDFEMLRQSSGCPHCKVQWKK